MSTVPDFRYIFYYVTKQSDPIFMSTLDGVSLSECDDCLAVIIDIENKTRYFNGKWQPMRIVLNEDECDR